MYVFSSKCMYSLEYFFFNKSNLECIQGHFHFINSRVPWESNSADLQEAYYYFKCKPKMLCVNAESVCSVHRAIINSSFLRSVNSITGSGT